MMGMAEHPGVRLDGGCSVLGPWSEGDELPLVRHANNYEVWHHYQQC
jgi:hypothetical protein